MTVGSARVKLREFLLEREVNRLERNRCRGVGGIDTKAGL